MQLTYIIVKNLTSNSFEHAFILRKFLEITAATLFMNNFQYNKFIGEANQQFKKLLLLDLDIA